MTKNCYLIWKQYLDFPILARFSNINFSLSKRLTISRKLLLLLLNLETSASASDNLDLRTSILCCHFLDSSHLANSAAVLIWNYEQSIFYDPIFNLFPDSKGHEQMPFLRHIPLESRAYCASKNIMVEKPISTSVKGLAYNNPAKYVNRCHP